MNKDKILDEMFEYFEGTRDNFDIDMVEEFLESYEPQETLIQDIHERLTRIENRKEILNEKTIIYSNIVIALRKQNKLEEARKIDLLIIKNLDKTFCKSYGRLISEYLNSNNFTLARYYYSLMKKYCDEKDLVPFQGIISQIEEEIEKRDAFTNQFSALKSAFTKK